MTINMVPRHIAAVCLAFSFAGHLYGQEYSSRIISHTEATPLPVATPTSPSLSTSSPASPSPAFPSLSRPEGQTTPAASEQERGSQSGPLTGPALTVSCSLAVVLGLFAGLVWMTRKFGNRSLNGGAIPKDVLQSLGSTAIDARTQITMLRCGNRIMIMAQTQTGVHAISEITDPDEVSQLTAACLGDSQRAFATTLRSIEKEKADPGYLGTPTEAPKPQRSPSRLFARA